MTYMQVQRIHTFFVLPEQVDRGGTYVPVLFFLPVHKPLYVRRSMSKLTSAPPQQIQKAFFKRSFPIDVHPCAV